MTWKRSSTPTGIPQYTLEGSDGWLIEADSRLSNHDGFVFGQYVNDADRKYRIVGWTAYSPTGAKIAYGRLAQCKAAIERRIS